MEVTASEMWACILRWVEYNKIEEGGKVEYKTG